MRRVSTPGAILALLAILITPTLYAEERPPGTEPPQARIGPPGGVASQAKQPPVVARFFVWMRAQIAARLG